MKTKLCGLLALLMQMSLLPAYARVQGSSSAVSPWDIEAKLYLGTPQSEKAAERGLEYLASRQSPDGHWVSGGYSEEVAITGLCLVAFLSAGYQPGRGRYGSNLDLAVNWLSDQVQMNGQFAPPGLIRAPMGGGPPMYGHGFALIALAEVYGMTHRRGLRPKLEAAIHLLEDTQNQDGQPWHDGGWRYQPRQGDADLSVTGVELLALRACINAGLGVSKDTINRAIGYVMRSANADGGFSYQIGQNQSDPARTGVGVLALYLAHLANSSECQGGLRYLMQHPLNTQNSWVYREHFHYTIYYVTQALYQAGGAAWKEWYPSIRDVLVKTQDNNGSWSSNPYGSDAGGVYATAVSVIVLQVPAGLLPLYQR